MISIAMTTYNGEKYLHEQIDSILAQTIQNFELVICDDCSKDSTWDILKEYSQIDNRIKIFRNGENIGFKKNFEKTLLLCKGDYIALSDQDDIWMPNHLEVLKSIIGDKMMSCGNCEMIDGKGYSLNISFKDLESLDYVPNKWKERIMSIIFFRNAYLGASMLLRKEFLNHCLPIPDGAYYHDTWFAVLSCFMGGFEYTPQLLHKYRLHENQVTHFYRVKRLRWKEFIKNVVHQCTYDRICLLDETEKRIPQMNDDDKSFLNEMRHHVMLDYTKMGRIKNLFFRLKNFRTIYSCKRLF